MNGSSGLKQENLLSLHAGGFTIGRDLVVTRLGFGAMRITGHGIWGEPRDPDAVIKVLRRAVELGVNFIDTADSYGPGGSERLIADALCPYPSHLVIATKGGLERPGPNQWLDNGRPGHLRSACEGSLCRLRLERIDLYQLHRLDPKVPGEDQLGTLKELQEAGKVKHIGLSEVTAAGRVVDSDNGLNRVAARLNASPFQVALAWLLARSRVMLPIPGTPSLAHLEENVAAAQLRIEPSGMREIDRIQGSS